jgi:hypothetical protein
MMPILPPGMPAITTSIRTGPTIRRNADGIIIELGTLGLLGQALLSLSFP